MSYGPQKSVEGDTGSPLSSGALDSDGMWMIKEHEIVLTGAHIEPECWMAAFILRCYGCPSTENRHEDSFIWRTDEEHHCHDFDIDFRAAIDALVQHLRPAGAFTDDEVRAAVFMARMAGRLDTGLETLQDVT
jgi:hypothetical protein